MSDIPFMKLYVADYLADTRHLSAEQHGAYLLLLMAMWRCGGRLPNEPSKLARIASVSLRRWHMIGPDVMEFFVVDGSEITQKRLEREHQKATSIIEKRIASGKLGGTAKALKNNETAVASAKQTAPYARAYQNQISELEPTSSLRSDVGPPSAKSTSPPDEPPDDPAPPRYAFEAGVIRLSASDLEKWRRAFPNLSLEAELWSLAEWASDQKRWFHAVAAALAKKQRLARSGPAPPAERDRDEGRYDEDGREKWF